MNNHENNASVHDEHKVAHDAHLENQVSADVLNRNAEARIRNPLLGIPYEQLMRDVEEFAHQKGLVDEIPILRKGALVAQNPTGYESITGPEALSESEKTNLHNEVHHKWRMPWRLLVTIATCSIGAAVQGWDQTGSNGATIFFPDHYGIGDKTSRHQVLLVGTINAGPYIGCALLGCWLSDPLNFYFGRRMTIFISAHFCLWPVIGSAFCNTWQEQLACRLLMGIGMGIKGATVPIYAAENAPASVRGALVMSWQMWTAFGIMLGTAINLAVFYHEHNWRLMLGLPAIPAVPLLVMIFWCPESPRWCMKKDRYIQAWKSLLVLRHDSLQAARDLYYVHAQLELEREILSNNNYITRFGQLFTIPRVRRATLAAFTVMLAQQMCGINIIAFYSTTIFESSGYSQFQALQASFGFGLINWLFAFPAFYTIDTFGRRSLLLFTFPNMMWSLLAAGLCNLLPEGSFKRTVLVAFFVYLFAAFYSPGEGPVPFAYSAEVFPLSHREVGMGFAAAVLGITFPLILETLDTIGSFGLYAGFNFAAFWMIFFWVPETKQRTLEELDYVFAVPTSKFAKYQLTQATPWFFKRYVLFQKHAHLEPLIKDDIHSRHHRAEPEAGVLPPTNPAAASSTVDEKRATP